MSTNLFTDFEAVSSDRWRAELSEALNGLSIDSLNTNTAEDIPVKAFYRIEDTLDLPVYPNLDIAVWKAGLLLREGSPIRREMEELAAEYSLGSRLICGDAFPWPNPSGGVTGCVFEDQEIFQPMDPYATLLKTGQWDERYWETADQGIDAARPRIWVDLDVYAEAGSHRVQELGYGLSHLVAQLDRYAGQLDGRSPEILIYTSLAGDFFLDIAKIRAIRWLAATLCRQYGLSALIRILVRPGLRNKTIYDYNNNLLRSALECTAGIIGGADEVFNLPYDIWFKSPHMFSERLAVTQLLVLKHEAHLNEAGELADRMYYVEYLTSSLAEKSLALLKRVQADGGIGSACLGGGLQAEVLQTAKQQQEDFDQGRQVLLGSNYQTNREERLGEQIDPAFRELLLDPDPRQTYCDRNPSDLPRLLPRRWAAGWESKRLREEFEQHSGN